MSIASVNASVQGAMAQVVLRTALHLSATDLQAMAVYLKALPGGFAATTSADPRPFGMPPYLLDLSDAQIAAVLTHIRNQWGNQAAAVMSLQVLKLRGG